MAALFYLRFINFRTRIPKRFALGATPAVAGAGHTRTLHTRCHTSCRRHWPHSNASNSVPHLLSQALDTLKGFLDKDQYGDELGGKRAPNFTAEQRRVLVGRRVWKCGSKGTGGGAGGCGGGKQKRRHKPFGAVWWWQWSHRGCGHLNPECCTRDYPLG